MSAIVKHIYPDYATALAACGPGYHDADIAEVVAFRTGQRIEPHAPAPEQALNTIIAVGIAAADAPNRQLHVLDFGGGCGLHFFRVATVTRTSLRWAIVETPTMAARASMLAQNYFRMFTKVSEAAAALGAVDLVHASGSIQFAPDPPATLRELVALRPRHILLARLPLWREPLVVGVQISRLNDNLAGYPMPPNMQDRETKYPLTFMNIDEVLRILDDFTVLLLMESPSGAYVVDDRVVPAVSLILRAKSA
jgi:putative methyltransferase (TIGR04325 family)